MKRKLLFGLFIIVLLVGSIYYFTRQEDINEAIDKSIKENKNISEIIEEAVIKETDEETEPVKTQIKTVILDTFKGTLGLLLNREPHIVAIGDSLTQGVGDEAKNGGYIGILDDTINEQKSVVEFTNLGRSGNRTDQLLKRLEKPEIISSIQQADIVLITIGANDIMRVLKQNITNLTYEHFAEEQVHFGTRLNNIFTIITDENAEADIYLLGFYNPFKQYFPEVSELERIVDEWNMTSKSISESYENITFIPLKDAFDNATENLFSSDNFHPNHLGYQKMAKRVLEYLTKEEEAIE